MKSPLLPLIFTLILISISVLPNSLAQDVATSKLPEGVKMRFGKGIIYDIEYAPDGTRLAVASSLGIWIYDVQTGQELDLLTGHTDPVRCIAFSPDGQTLASGSCDNTIRLWNTSSGNHIGALRGHSAQVFSIAFSPDSQMLVSSSRDKTVRLWSMNYRREIRKMRGSFFDVYSVDFNPDGQTIATAEYGKVRLWSVNDGREIRQFIGDTKNVRIVSFSPNGELLVSASEDNHVRLWR